MKCQEKATNSQEDREVSQLVNFQILCYLINSDIPRGLVKIQLPVPSVGDADPVV